MPKQSYREILAEQKVAQATTEQQVENAYREREKQKMSPAEQVANTDKVLDKSPTDEFTDLRSAIDIVYISLKTLVEINQIRFLKEEFRKHAGEIYRIQNSFYHAMLEEEHNMFSKVFQGDEE